MRNLVLLLVVALLAVPAMAADPVVYLQAGAGTGEVDVMYDATDANLPSGIGLTVSVDAGTITDVTGFKTDVSTAASPGYGIFPGQVVISGGTITEANTPVNSADFAGTGIGTDTVVLEFGALYDGEPNKPLVGGKLCTITVDTSCTVTLAGNDKLCGAGNGIIGEDLVAYAVGDTLVVSLCSIPFGDFDGDGDVDFIDFGTFKDAYGSTPGAGNWNADCDSDGDGDVDFMDFGDFKDNYGSTC